MRLEFKIKNPLWAIIVVWIIFAVGVLAVTITTILYFVISISCVTLITLDSVGAVLAIIGIVCGYAGIVEKFELRDGNFYYTKPFKKNQSAAVHNIAKVVRTVHPRAYPPTVSTVVFYDKEGKKLINFFDDGVAFRSGEIERALKELNIPYIIKYLPQ